MHHAQWMLCPTASKNRGLTLSDRRSKDDRLTEARLRIRPSKLPERPPPASALDRASMSPKNEISPPTHDGDITTGLGAQKKMC
jgi:hypothetical protein